MPCRRTHTVLYFRSQASVYALFAGHTNVEFDAKVAWCRPKAVMLVQPALVHALMVLRDTFHAAAAAAAIKKDMN